MKVCLDWSEDMNAAPRDGKPVVLHNDVDMTHPSGVAQEINDINTAIATWEAAARKGEGQWWAYNSPLHFKPTHWARPFEVPGG